MVNYASFHPTMIIDELRPLDTIRTDIASICEMAQSAWAGTPWRDSLDLLRAVRLGYVAELSGARTTLPAEEIEAVRSWVQDKCNLWHISTPILLRYLESFQRFDPQLLQGVYHDPLRDSKNAHGNKDTDITPSDVYVIAMCLPGQYELQGKALTVVRNDSSLSVKDVRKLATALSQATSLESADTIISSGSWRRLPHAAPYFSDLPQPLPSVLPAPELNTLFEESLGKVQDMMRRNNSITETNGAMMATPSEPAQAVVMAPIENSTVSVKAVMLDWIEQVRIWLPRKLNLSTDAAEDCIQEALKKTLEHIRYRNLVFEHPGELYKWLNTTAYNNALDWIDSS